MTGKKPIRVTRRTLAFGTSVAAMCVAAVTPAWGQCAPDPSVANATTTCAGTDSDGVAITTAGTTLSVTQGALVTATTTPAVTINVPTTTYDGTSNTIVVAGEIDGGGQSGIAVYPGVAVPPLSFGLNHVTLTVMAGGEVTGSTALSLSSANPPNGYFGAFASVDNDGTLSGTSGLALSASAELRTGFDVINNEASGTIGAIAGPIGILTNAGLIDGGARSAIDATADINIGLQPGAWTNSGTIRSASTAATVLNIGQLQPLTNSGAITNGSSGAAIQGAYLTITNLAGGTISTAGTTAISATSEIDLTNGGTIVGNIVADPASGTGFFSTIDSSNGTIDGNVSLGRGNDVLVARYDGTPTLVTGITGTIDAGDGINSIELAPTQDLTIATPVSLLAGFQQLQLAAAQGVTITLASGFVAPSTIVLSGTGAVINQAQIVTNGPAFEGTAGGFTNAGSIVASVSNGNYGLYIGAAPFTNSGTINVTGDGVFGSGGGMVTNTGTITATDTAVSLVDTSIDNQGLIRSTGGTAVDLSDGGSGPYINSGRIEGVDYGVTGGITNSGTITATGTAVGLESNSVLNNLAGGVVTGGTFAVTGHDPYGSTTASNATIFNAGTINGDVVLPGNGTSFYPSGNTFVALTGGVLNGNLTLGNTDVLVTDLVNTGSGAFAGITGTVTSNGGLLRYRVGSDASATIGPVGPFAIAGYELAGGATLQLGASAPQTQTLVLAGDGRVDLTADIATTNANALSVVPAATVPDATPTASPGLTITSHGTLSGVRNDYFSTNYGVVSLGTNDALINDGTIIATYSATNGGGSDNPAVYTGSYPFDNTDSFTNNGTLKLDGTTGVQNVATVVNTGSIVQTGSGISQGIVDAITIDNRGIIDVSGVAIGSDFYLTSLTNSGTIISRAGVAVSVFGDFDTAINNLAGGTITAGPAQNAINLYSGSVTNAGTINGDVNFGDGFGVAGSVYVAAGGTLNGNLHFGSTDDVFVSLDGATGVTGTIDAGGGTDTYVKGFSSSTSTQLAASVPATFEAAGIEALGADTVVTVTGALPNGIGAPRFYGNGTIVNQVDIPAGVPGAAPTIVQLAGIAGAYDGSGLAFTNTANVNAGFTGIVRAFSNSGSITLPQIAYLTPTSAPFSFTNSGTITGPAAADGAGNSIAMLFYNEGNAQQNGSADFANSGTIDGGIAALVMTPALSFENSGAIRGDVIMGAAVDDGVAPTSMVITASNSGTMLSNDAASTTFEGYYDHGGSDPSTRPAPPPESITLANSGSIGATGNGSLLTFINPYGTSETDYVSTSAVLLSGDTGAALSLTNAAAGTIFATGTGSTAIVASAPGGTFSLTNAGTITGSAGTTIPSGGQATVVAGVPVPSGFLAGAIEVVGATSVIHNSGTITGSILLGDGNDTIVNSGTIAGDVFLGAGDDSFQTLASATLTGRIDGGAGSNALTLDSTGSSGAQAFDLGRFVNFQSLTVTGSGALGLAGALPFATVQLTGGTLNIPVGATLSTTGPTAITGGDLGEKVVNQGTITGAVDLGGGDDRFENHGSVTGPIALGDGNDVYAAYPGATMTTVDGGTGINTIELHSDGTDAAPTLFEAAGYSNFEQLSQKEGVTAFDGALRFDEVAVDGGRLIGLAGSVLTVPGGVSVASGATFGSAGTVVGDITVAGTLSPGASPGTMTVRGNVTLQAGSHSLFELSTGISDQLHATGAITIANGATLDLTGVRPLTPGAALDLVIADGGITGSFATINQPSTIFGFIRQTADSIELFGQFANTGFKPQVSATIAYVNGVLTSSAANPALIAAAPSLLTSSGATNGAAFARLNPEAYASAMQIGIENGLSLAKAARSGVAVNPSTAPGLFSFAQGLGGWRTLGGNGALGTSQAKLQSHGELGGVGYGSARASLAAFVGYMKTNEGIAALGAHADASDTIAGVIGHLGLGGFDVSALLAYDGGRVGLSRTAIGDTKIGSRFGLRSWVGDLQLGYAFRLGKGWALKPQAGLTYVGEHRGAANESGSSAFDLAVAADHQHAAFVDGTLALEGGLDADAKVHPWLSGGVRRQLSGERTTASASFVGASTDIAVAGVGRSRTLATAVAGLSVDLSHNVSLFASYNGEFGKNGDGNGVNGGLKMRF